MTNLPTGTFAFLFTDVVGSTRLWEQHPDPMRRALARHDALIQSLTERHDGQVVRPRGECDSRVRPRTALREGDSLPRCVHHLVQCDGLAHVRSLRWHRPAAPPQARGRGSDG